MIAGAPSAPLDARTARYRAEVENHPAFVGVTELAGGHIRVEWRVREATAAAVAPPDLAWIAAAMCLRAELPEPRRTADVREADRDYHEDMKREERGWGER